MKWCWAATKLSMCWHSCMETSCWFVVYTGTILHQKILGRVKCECDRLRHKVLLCMKRQIGYLDFSKLARDAGLCDWARHQIHRSLTRQGSCFIKIRFYTHLNVWLTDAKSMVHTQCCGERSGYVRLSRWQLCHFVQALMPKKKKGCSWKEPGFCKSCQCPNDNPESQSMHTHVEAWAILPPCCVSAEVGPADMNSDEDVCWQLSGTGRAVPWLTEVACSLHHMLLFISCY